MGCAKSFFCKDCKKCYYLGYGGYGSWFPFCTSVKQFDAEAAIRPAHATLFKNQNMRKCLVEHKGHSFDYVYHDDYDLQDLVPNAGEYERIDLYDSDPECLPDEYQSSP